MIGRYETNLPFTSQFPLTLPLILFAFFLLVLFGYYELISSIGIDAALK
jgi:hypothetical protein